MVGVDIRIDDAFELKLGPENQPGQSEATDRCLEKLRVLIGRTDRALTIGAQKAQAGDMAAKRAAGMMVFAVDIVSNRAPHGDELGARSHRQKPASRNHDVENLGQGNAGLATEQACLFIERNKAVEMADIERHAVLVEAAIAVAASIGVRQNRLSAAGEIGNLAAPVDGRDLCVLYSGVTTPGLNLS